MAQRTFKCAAIQMNSSADVGENLERCQTLVATASQRKAQLVVLPETFAMIGSRDETQQQIAEELDSGPIQEALSQMARDFKVWIVAGTIPIKEPDHKVFATSILLNPQGERCAVYQKIHLFDVDLPDGTSYRESATFSAGKQPIIADTPFAKIGMAVCYDLRFPELFRLLGEGGADIMVLPSAFTAFTGEAHWETLLRARAIENQVWMVGAGQYGMHANHKKTYGHSMIVDPWGTVIERAGGSQDAVSIATIDLDQTQQVRARFPCLKHQVL